MTYHRRPVWPCLNLVKLVTEESQQINTLLAILYNKLQKKIIQYLYVFRLSSDDKYQINQIQVKNIWSNELTIHNIWPSNNSQINTATRLLRVLPTTIMMHGMHSQEIYIVKWLEKRQKQRHEKRRRSNLILYE